MIACILPHWLYCSPVIFPGLKKKDFVLFSRSMKLLSRCSGIARNALIDFIISKHIDACDRFINRIMSNEDHFLHKEFFKSVSNPRTRSQFRLLPARTTTYRNSILPYLARILVNRTSIMSDLNAHLLC